MNYEKLFAEKLDKVKDANLMRTIPQIKAGAEKYITINGKKCLNLSSNNYLGLSLNKRIVKASKEAISKYGTSSSASRIVTGNYAIYDELEKEMSDFKGYEACLILGCGYIANLSIIPAICDRSWVIFSDKLCHASIIDGIKLSSAKHVRYRHNDMEHLEFCLKRYDRNVKKLVITDTVFSMDGDIADLQAIVRLARKYKAMIMVDEAHATGIFGHGRGLTNELNLQDSIDINMGTFSKALGSYGAYVCASRTVIDYLTNGMRGFIFSTSLPPPAVIGANLESLKILREDNGNQGKKLLKLAKTIRKELKKLGFNTLNSESQIIPIVTGREKLFFCRDFLIKKGIHAAAIRPPTVPVNTDRLRLSLRADLTNTEVINIISAFKELRKCL